MSSETDSVLMNKNVLNRQKKYRLAAYLLVVAVGAFGLWRVSESANDAEMAALEAQEAAEDVETAAELATRAAEVADAESQRRATEICEAANQNRAIMLQLILFTAENNGTDFSQVPGFDQLDPEMQQFLENLRDPNNSNLESAFVQRARELLAPQDCKSIL